ncbi:MAG TPA: dethiobiotin synthase [Desulfomonilaceae bacterium]|nr:dethiobiotin synthase [Desulfomonilaceae bacterium]
MSKIFNKKGLFIAGTDTGVGKTILAAGLVRLARNRGLRAVAVKPVETGCAVREGMLYPEDGSFLREASERDLSLDECVPFRFSLPASPARAAAAMGSGLYISDLKEHILAITENADLTVVEAAGGIMVPIQENLMMLDLIQLLGFPIVIAARSNLGTINHTLLTHSALRQRDLETVGIVLSCCSPNRGPEEQFTPTDIARLIQGIPVLVLPYMYPEIKADSQRIAEIMAAAWPEEIPNRWLGCGD